MRRILTIVLSALLLSACMADWKSDRTGPRWSGDTNVGQSGDNGRTINMNASAASGRFPP
jgi:hypothetical protein